MDGRQPEVLVGIQEVCEGVKGKTSEWVGEWNEVRWGGRGGGGRGGEGDDVAGGGVEDGVGPGQLAPVSIMS